MPLPMLFAKIAGRWFELTAALLFFGLMLLASYEIARIAMPVWGAGAGLLAGLLPEVVFAMFIACGRFLTAKQALRSRITE